MNPEALLTPAQARNVLHNLARLKAGYGFATLEGLCADLVGAEASKRLALILNRLADGNDEHVTLLNSDYPPNLGLLNQLSIAGVRVISHQMVTFYRVQREDLFEQIRLLWNVPYSWTTQLIVRRPVTMLDYSQYILSVRWKLTREAALRRDGKACIRCGRKDKLQAHHKTYARLGDEALDDLVTLCMACHRLEHPAQGAAAREMKHDATH